MLWLFVRNSIRHQVSKFSERLQEEIAKHLTVLTNFLFLNCFLLVFCSSNYCFTFGVVILIKKSDKAV